jgi:molybdate transport system substrate-binding protein
MAIVIEGRRFYSRLCCCVLMWLLSVPANADTLTIATASNFQKTLQELIALYRQTSSDVVVPVVGASGGLYTQIKNGAPFDLYLSADEEHAKKLVTDGLAVDATVTIYAIGRVALWAPKADSEAKTDDVLTPEHRIAIAEPSIAPYGRAAVEILKALHRYDSLSARLVFGKSVSLAHQFVASGNAYAGFVSLAQVLQVPANERGWYWIAPDTLHAPINQCAVILKRSHARGAAQRFLELLTSEQGKAVITRAGYGVEAKVDKPVTPAKVKGM